MEGSVNPRPHLSPLASPSAFRTADCSFDNAPFRTG